MAKADVRVGTGAWFLTRLTTARRTLLLGAFLGLLAILAGSIATAANYVYDGNGRLVVMTNDAGQSARYEYDELGNLLRIDRLVDGQLALFSLTPRKGSAGTQVAIQGQGLSATPSANQVFFNGVPALVTSATGTKLTAVVPVGAATGPVTITVGAQTATAPGEFVVDESAKPPVIHGVSPLIVSVGASISVTGDQLEPVPNKSRVHLNGRTVPLTAIGNAGLSVAVPIASSSGRVSVVTPHGWAESSQDVIVAPDGVNPSDIVAGGELVAGGAPRAVAATSTTQQTALLVRGESGLMSSLHFSGLGADVSYALYNQTNALVLSGVATSTRPTVHLPLLGASSYLLLMKSNVAPANWNVVLERNPILPVNGESIAVTTTIPGQEPRFVFFSETTSKLGLGISNFAQPAGDEPNFVTMWVYGANGSQVAYRNCYAIVARCAIDLPDLPAGMYSVVMGAPRVGNRKMAFDATLSTAVSAPLEPGTPYNLSLDRFGQGAYLTFEANAGDAVQLMADAEVTVPSTEGVWYDTFAPDGSLVASQMELLPGRRAIVLNDLPLDGTYAIRIRGGHGEKLAAQLLLSRSEQVNHVLVDGADPLGLATQLRGQIAHFSFTASAGQDLGIGLSEIATPGTESGLSVVILRPDGSQLQYKVCYQTYGGCDLNLRGLAAGTYTALVLPPSDGARTMSFKLALSADHVGTIQSGTPYQLELRKGQNASLSYEGQAGSNLALQVLAGATDPADKVVRFTFYRPDGSVLLGGDNRTGVTVVNLPVSGTYRLFLDPEHGAGASSLRVLASTGGATSVPVNGSSAHHQGGSAGQAVLLGFEVAEGQNVGLGISGLAIDGATNGYAKVRIFDPEGSTVTTEQCYPDDGGCDLDLPGLQAGTYGVIVEPANGDGLITFDLTLSSDLIQTLSTGETQALTIARRGQNARLAFSATDGQALALRIAEQTTSTSGDGVTYTVLDPSGDTVAEEWVEVSRTLYLIDPPLEIGTYTVFVDPDFGSTATSQVTLSSLNLTATGPSQSFSSSVPGEMGQFAFQIASGESLSLDIGNLLTPGTTAAADVVLHRPGGSWLTKACTAGSNCGFNLSGYATGEYRLEVAPPEEGDETVSFTATLSPILTGALAANSPTVQTLSRNGQKARLLFSATAGQSISLVTSDQVTTPAGKTVSYRINKPDGTQLRAFSAAAGTTIHQPGLPSTGTYSVLIELPSGATGSVRTELNTGGSLSVGGASKTFSSAVPWERSYLTFVIGTTTATLKLRTTQMSTPGSTGSARVEVHRPNGTSTYQSCAAGTATCTLSLTNVAPGTYGVVVHPPAGGNGSMSFSQSLATQ